MIEREYVIKLAGEIYTPEGVEIWMRSRNRLLGNRTPDELIEAGETDKVLAVIEALATGAVL